MKRRWMTRPFNSAPSTHANSFKRKSAFNPFASKSDQFQISPAASPEILHQTEGRTWLFIAYSDERRISSQFSLQHLYISLLKRLGECTFSRTSLSMIVVTIRETSLSQNKTKTAQLYPFIPNRDQFQNSPAVSPEILHHTVWRTWLFVAYSVESLLYYQFSLPHLYISL